MARWATFCELGEVSFTGCRVELIDPGPFKSIYSGSVTQGNDATPDVQVVNRGVKGIHFGTRMVSAEQTKLADLFAAIATAESVQGTIKLKITDGLFIIDVLGHPDYSVDWFTFGKQSEGWYEDVVLRWISAGPDV